MAVVKSMAIVKSMAVTRSYSTHTKLTVIAYRFVNIIQDF